MSGTNADVRGLGGFVWSIAEILRGDFKQSEYGKVILPFIVLRRLDCLLDASKRDVLEAAKGLSDAVDDPTRDMILFAAAGENIKVYNLSAFTFESLKAQDPGQLHDNLIDYITKFSGNVRDIFLDKFLFTEQLKRLNEGGILWQVFDRFTQIDLHPERVDNIEMGYLFEDLIRRFSEISNETAGEHFTPREVIRLIVELLIANDDTRHETVNHSIEEWVVGDVHTNGIEGVWSLFKCSIVGTFHKMSRKHMDRYLEELEWRFNNRDNLHIFHDTLTRIMQTGNLTYRELVA